MSRTRIITALAPDLLVGVTATPDRADGKGLGRIYQEVVYSLSMIELMARGRLARLRGLRIDTGDSLDAVATRAGEFAQDQLEQAVNTPSRNDLVVRTWLEYARDRTRTVAFTVDVRHAHDLAAAFGAAGIAARAVSGATPADERRATLAAFHAGDIPVLTNCNVLTEGWDEPATDCILMTRPTKSRALYTQMVGRGARRAAGKSDCLIIDYCDSTSRHQLVTLPSLADDPLKQGPEKGSSPRVVGDRRRDGEQIDLLDFAIEREAVAASVNLLSTGAFTWQSLGPGVHVASAGNRCWIALHATAAGTVPYWVEQDAATWGYRREPLFDRPLDAEMALGLAEDQALKRGAAPHLVRRDAPWRQRASNERPTAAQINAAQRARIRLTGTESKHEIGVLLDEHFSRRALHAVGLLEGTKR